LKDIFGFLPGNSCAYTNNSGRKQKAKVRRVITGFYEDAGNCFAPYQELKI
jgi:hypothetical protein